MRAWCLVGVLAVVALATPGCSDKPKESVQSSSPVASTPTPTMSIGARVTVGGQTVNYHGTEEIAGAQSVAIEMADGYFEPTVLFGKPGQQLVVTLKNTGKNPHQFTTADQQFIVEVQPGMTAEGKVTLPTAGNLSFYCSTEKEAGMAGAFNVSGPLDAHDKIVKPTGR
jgi:plastocyanin